MSFFFLFLFFSNENKIKIPELKFIPIFNPGIIISLTVGDQQYTINAPPAALEDSFRMKR